MSLFKIVTDRTYSSAHRRRSAAFCVCLALLAGLHGFAVDQDVLNTLPIEPTTAYDFKIPPRPSGHILDTAHFLPQEMLQTLDDALSREARDHGVNIYLLTVPSVQKNTLEPFTQRVAEEWTRGLFGATIVFDDGTGRVAIQQSDQVAKRFYEFELSVLLKDTMSTSKRPRLSREALQHTTLNLKDSVYALKMRADREDRNSLRTRMGFGILGLLALVLGGFEYFRRRQVAGSVPGEIDPATK